MNLIEMKKQIINMNISSREGHIPSSFSILDILWVLYDKVLKITPETVLNKDRDRFILSKGHASLALYVILAKKGFILKSELDNYCKYDSILGGHPNCNKISGVEASTGSLGHGFPIAVGIALGNKIQTIPAKTYVLIGDGEANEGTIWESAMLASHHDLSNLCCILDYNHSTDRAISIANISRKFESFGWDVCTVNGHNQELLFRALTHPHLKPLMIIANTIKGNGCKIMENNPEWHHKTPNEKELSLILADLK